MNGCKSQCSEDLLIGIVVGIQVDRERKNQYTEKIGRRVYI